LRRCVICPETRRGSQLDIDIRIELRIALVPLGDWDRIGDHLKKAEVLARLLGEQHRLGQIATLMMNQCRLIGDYDAALKFGQEALTIARTLGDRSIEAVATFAHYSTHAVRGEYAEAAKMLEQKGKLRAERSGSPVIPPAMSEYALALVLAPLGRFDEAIGHGEAAVRVAEETDHPWRLFLGLLHLGWAHLGRGDFPRACRVLERCLHFSHTWQFVDRTPDVAATLGYAYAIADRTEESVAMVAGAVKEFRARRHHVAPFTILLSAGKTYLAAGRDDQAINYARETLALTRRRGARGVEATALSLIADIATASGAEKAEGYYHEALSLAEPRGLRPQVAHCHFGLGKFYRRRGDRERAEKHLTTAMAMYHEMGMIYWPEQAEVELRQLG